MKIIESLDYGMSLLSDGSILKADGTIISKLQYEEQQVNAIRNRLDWIAIDVDDFVGYLERAKFATKTYEINEDSQGMSISKMGFALIDEEGQPLYLRSSEFSGAETYEMTQVEYGKLLYNVDRNSTEEAFDVLVDVLEEIFETKEQLGSMFSPDSETNYLTKRFIYQGYMYKMTWKNNKLHSIKQGAKIHTECEVRPKTSKLADLLNSTKFANLH